MELKLDSAAQKTVKQQAIVDGEKEPQSKKMKMNCTKKKIENEAENLLNSELVEEIKSKRGNKLKKKKHMILKCHLCSN